MVSVVAGVVVSAQLYRKPVVLKFSPRVMTKTLILYSVHQLKYQISLTLKLEGGRLIWYIPLSNGYSVMSTAISSGSHIVSSSNAVLLAYKITNQRALCVGCVLPHPLPPTSSYLYHQMRPFVV